MQTISDPKCLIYECLIYGSKSGWSKNINLNTTLHHCSSEPAEIVICCSIKCLVLYKVVPIAPGLKIPQGLFGTIRLHVGCQGGRYMEMA